MPKQVGLWVFVVQLMTGLGCASVQQAFAPLPTLQVQSPPTQVQATLPATRTAAPAFTVMPAATVCLNDAQFVADLTVADGSILLAGETFSKQWQIRNTGDCAWGAAYQVVFSKGNKLGGNDLYALYPAMPGSLAVVEMQLAAPLLAGDYQSEWRLVDGQGQFFGTPLTVKIRVVAATKVP